MSTMTPPTRSILRAAAPAAAAVLCLLVLLPAAPLAAQEGRTVIGSEGIERGNDPIRVSDDGRVQGPILARNGSVTIGARSEVASVSSRNGRITIGHGTTVSGPVDTRNGRVELGDGVAVAGPVESRNGRIEIGDDALVRGFVDTRNGRIVVGAGTYVAGDVSSRNGGITLGSEASVGGNVTTRNGEVRLEGARVARNVDVGGGNLHLGGQSRIEGDVIVLMDEGRGLSWLPFFGSRARRPVVRIGSDVRIGGRLIVDERARLEIERGADVPEPEVYPNRRAWPGR